ncbi:hypothetical protein ACG2F4_04655 [Halalkalibaculum sp. DA3122]|uniref:hypothetical protein n=1 Tax=Halalkalibaculum sp. DA3122 TaxID=3373607 RepID=UPI0037546B7F
MPDVIQHNIQQVRERVVQACHRAGRNPEEVQISTDENGMNGKVYVSLWLEHQ